MTKTCKFNSEAFNQMQIEDNISKLDKAIAILERDKDKYFLVVFLLALILNPSLCYADKIAVYGANLLSKIQIYMGVVASIMCSIEIATELIKGGRNYFQILFKYGTGYVALIVCPMIFNVIKELF